MLRRPEHYTTLLAKYLHPEQLRVVLLAALLFSNTGLQLVNPLLLRHFVDATRTGQALETLISIALVFIGVAIIAQVIGVIEAYVAEDIGWRATNQLRDDLTQHVLELDLGFHNTHTPGELIQRLDYDVGTLANFFSRFVLRVLASILLLAGTLIVLIWIDWRIGLAFAGFVATGLAALHRVRRLVLPYAKADLETMGAQFGYIEERLTGTEDIRARGATGYVLRGLYRHMRDRLQARRNAGAMFVALVGTMGLLSALGTAVAYTVGGYLFQTGAITLGTVFAIVNYLALVSRPLGQLTQEMHDFQQAAAGIARVQELLETSSTVQDGPGVPISAGALAVDLEHVSFRYSDGELVLHDLSFALRPGTVLGVLGRTGSGKTTLTRLLLRLYDPTSGVVRLAGVNLRDARQRDIRERVGMVTQEVQLFRATVRDNATFFDRSVPDERILRTFRILGLSGWYEGLPAGLDTELAGAEGLSAGEAQLLAFARIFLKNPGLVILDEASSRLDPATERRIERAVDVLLEDRTAVIVAHRLETLNRVDDVLILEDGRIVEYGGRARLAANPMSRYARLLRSGSEALA